MENLVHKFLANTITDDELRALKKWLEDPKNKDYLKKVITTDYQLDYAYRKIDLESAYQRIVERTSAKPKPVINLRRRPYALLKYAAAILVLLGVSSLFYLTRSDHGEVIPMDDDEQITLQLEDGSVTVLVENSRGMIKNNKGENIVRQENNKLVYTPSDGANEKMVYNILKVPYGKRFQIQLADSTLVVLNAGTTLRYPKDFINTKSRDVFLNGEALFAVERNRDHKFVVHTENMNIRVLGTKFNVTSYNNEKASSTVLVEGQVEVYQGEGSGTSESIAISPGELASTIDDGFEVIKVDVNKHIAWVDGTLLFTNDPFQNIIRELERHYNVMIINRNQELDKVRYTGTFRSETLEQILQVFQRNTEFDYEVKNDTIIIDTPDILNQKKL